MKKLFVSLAFALGLVACVVPTTKPPSPQPPPPAFPEYRFAIVTVPDAPCTVTIEGYAAGPQFTPNGFLYLGDKIPAYQSPIPEGAIRLDCTGYLPQIWTKQVWKDLQANGNNFYKLAPIKGKVRVPSKHELMEAQYTFQGLRANCPEYDSRPIPIFDPMIDVVDDSCKAAILQSHRDAGDKVIGVAISHKYDEPGIIPILRAGRDWTGDLPGLHDYLSGLIDEGFYIQLHLAGDGHSVKQNGNYVYNDPVGNTYGCEWLSEFFPKLADSLDDIHQYIRFLPGYDGIFYGCEDDGLPVKIPAFAKQFKARWPDGVLGIEFNVGHLPFGEGDADWQPNGRMKDFDMVFAEFDGDINQDSTWQIVARLQKKTGDYHRPSEQPASDDPNPPPYLRNWPGVAVCFEWDTYDDVRFKTTPQSVAAKREKLRAMGCSYTG